MQAILDILVLIIKILTAVYIVKARNTLYTHVIYAC